MPKHSPIIAGTVTLVNGSKDVVGLNTAVKISGVQNGDTFNSAGLIGTIDAVADDTHFTLIQGWPGAGGGAQEYMITRDGGAVTIVANEVRLEEILRKIETVLFLDPDEEGTLAGRDAFDEQPAGFLYVVTDDVSGDLFGYFKDSATSGDWAGPFAWRGEKGAAGENGAAFTFTGTGVPSGGLGVDDNTYLNVANFDVYTKAGTWSVTGTLVGPTGSIENVKGSYLGPTQYFAGDLVLDQNSSWVALLDTIGNAPPTLPATSNTQWQLVAKAGADGAGGDMESDGSVVMTAALDMGGFAPTNAAGFAPIVAGELAGLASSGALSGDEIVLLGNGQKATLAAILELVGSGENDALFALEIADLKGDRLGITGGIADPFDDESDVDTGNSTNQVYDAAGDFYKPLASPSLISQGAGTPIGDLVDGGGVAAAFDGNLSQHRNDGAKYPENTTTGVHWIGKDWGLGSERKIAQVRVYGPNNTGIHETDTSVRLRVEESSTGLWAGEEVTIGDTGFIDTSGADFVLDIPCAGASTVRYHRFTVVASVSSATSVAELQFYEPGTVADMELISGAFTAQVEPGTARLVLQVKENEAITINTDLVAHVQRVSGAWAQATLVLKSQSGDLKIYEDNEIDISGQSPGTAMKYKVDVNGKDVELHGVVEQWN